MGTSEQPAVMDFGTSGAGDVALVGGKGAALAALTALDGVDVPAGFCVTTDVYRRAVASDPSVAGLLVELEHLTLDSAEAIGQLGGELREAVATVDLPRDDAAAIRSALSALGKHGTYAVRSSATGEDSVSTSFAGQHHSYLGIGGEEVIEHVRRCWASLFTEQAVTYRLRSGVRHSDIAMAVVVQRMVQADAAGVMFTADPVSGNRRVVSIEAVRGLGDALVSGLVSPDRFQLRDGTVSGRSATSGTSVLTDQQATELAALGRHIEAQFGQPQDIEWCLDGGEFSVVQSRPITTLFPVPDAGDDARHVFISVGHQQMMTDPMKPLGLSLWQLKAMPPMHEAGGRLFVDIAERLASAAARDAVVAMLGQGDPLIGDALKTVIDRDFIEQQPQDSGDSPRPIGGPAPQEPLPADPAIVDELVAGHRASIAALERDIVGVTGPALFDFILDDIQTLKRMIFDPRSTQVIMGGMEAAWWLNDQLEGWLGEKNAADALAQSVPGNVTSEMGLDLLDVADAIRPHPEVVAYLEGDIGDDFLDALLALPGGNEARSAITGYLERYGMRCVGEIDITRPRWSEHPAALVPAILGNLRNFEPGAGPQRFAQGRERAQARAQELLGRLRALPGGDERAAETEQMIARLRTFSGYREFPKYAIVCRSAIYKRALLTEAARLVEDGVLRTAEDCFYLRFEEFAALVGGKPVDLGLIDARRGEFRRNQALTPPRVITSEGETISGSYGRDDVPAGALVGLAVSAGTVEGRARVVPDLGDAVFEPGDILVTAFTDPSWTPAFVSISGLVTEVGGQMTHGAVIAREYGLPAVVGIEGATTAIRDGQRVRVHGTDGFVELLT